MAALLAVVTLSACGDGSPAWTTRDRDRDRIHQAITAMLEACADQDRDGLRDGMHDRMHDEADGAMFQYHERTHFEVMDEMMRFGPDDDAATVETRLRIREAGRMTTEAMFRWHFERSGSQWRSVDLPPCLDGDRDGGAVP